MKKSVVFLVAVLIFTGTLAAAHAVNAEIQSGAAAAAPSSAAAKTVEPGTVVQAYYRALNGKNVSLATPLLSDNIVLKVSQPYGDGTLDTQAFRPCSTILQEICGASIHSRSGK